MATFRWVGRWTITSAEEWMFSKSYRDLFINVSRERMVYTD